MPDEIEVPLENAQEHVAHAHEEHDNHNSGHHGSEGPAKPGEGWIRYMAVTTAILAVVAAIGALQGGLLINESLLQKNEQIKNLTQASDTWNYYQAEGLKALIYSSTAQTLAPESPNVKKDKDQAKYYKGKQEDLQKEAQKLTDESKKNSEESEMMLRRHHLFAISVSLCQIAIAMSAIAALTKRFEIWVVGVVGGVIGVAMVIIGFLPTHLLTALHLM